MMPLALFGTRSFVGVTLLTLCLYAALGGMVVLLPYLLIRGAGWSATGGRRGAAAAVGRDGARLARGRAGSPSASARACC